MNIGNFKFDAKLRRTDFVLPEKDIRASKNSKRNQTMEEGKQMSKYYRTFDGMCWPVPGEDLEECAWRAIHATPDKTDLLVMSSVVAAYAELIRLPQKQRNEIIRELRRGVDV